MTPLAPQSTRVLDWVRAYYLATPVFAVLDFALGAPVRVAGLDDPMHRGVYYAAAFGLGFVARAKPETTPWIGMLESAANITLLIVAVMMPIWSMPEAIWAGEELTGPFDRVSIVNFVISGSAFAASFYRNQAAMLEQRGRGRGPRGPGS